MTIALDLEDLLAMPRTLREWVMTFFFDRHAAHDLAVAVGAGDIANHEPLIRDLVVAGELREGQVIRSARAGASDATITGDVAWFRGDRFASLSLLARYMAKKPGRGRLPKWGAPLDRVNDDGTRTPLTDLMHGPARDHMQRRLERENAERVLAALGKPFHHCPTCGKDVREVKRQSISGATLASVTLLCRHSIWTRCDPS